MATDSSREARFPNSMVPRIVPTPLELRNSLVIIIVIENFSWCKVNLDISTAFLIADKPTCLAGASR